MITYNKHQQKHQQKHVISANDRNPSYHASPSGHMTHPGRQVFCLQKAAVGVDANDKTTII